MDFLQAFENKTILMPLLQRDYVQGKKGSIVIGPFLDALLTKECDLNYIYGYNENGCFVPIDGQQRLTTLWLLHLYVYAYNHKLNDFTVGLKFASREFANDFCEALTSHLEEVLETATCDLSLDKVIENQNWFIRSWRSNATVRNMLGTLKLLHFKIKTESNNSVWERLVERESPTITFAFLQMDESNGLDDDIYIKMNGRGRCLSMFENLKSWMDEQVNGLNFAEEWKSEMDNSWTDLFWKNRNLSQEHPEEIDDEQLHFFYNLLALYHIKNGFLIETVKRIKKEEKENVHHLFEELQSFLECEDIQEENKLAEKIIDKLIKANNMPLIWIERLELMSNDFFKFAFEKIQNLVGLYEQFNESGLYIENASSEKTSKTYQISMCEGTFDRTLPLFYSIISYKQGGKTSLLDWMRVMRNLIFNTDIERKDLRGLLQIIEDFSERCKENEIYGILKDDGENALKGFKKKQVSEEIKKARLLQFYPQMMELENGRFFKGHISCLFKMLSPNPDECQLPLNEENVICYKDVLLSIFDGSRRGVAEELVKEGEHLLRRALMTFKPYYYGINEDGWCFCNSLEEWRKYLNTDEKRDLSSLCKLLRNVLAPAYKKGLSLCEVLRDHVENLSKHYEELILNEDNDSFRQHFIHHPGVWDYMQAQRCTWTDNFDIVLKTRMKGGCNHMELRTYSLYLDYSHNAQLRADYKGWEVGIWPKVKTCMYFQREICLREETATIAIDIYFYDSEGKRTNEDCYSLDLFIRTTHPDPDTDEEKLLYAEEDYQKNKDLFNSFIPDLMNLFVKKEDGRLRSSSTYSRRELIKTIRLILCGINENLDTPNN